MYTGRKQLVERLTSQVGSRDMAIGILIKRGLMKKDGKTLTALGQVRNAMTAAERAKSRASKKSGRSVSEYTYNPKTNRATLKR